MSESMRIALVVGLSALGAAAPIAAAPGGMTMYVFPEQRDDAALSVATTGSDGTPKNMKMVVFDGGASTAQPGPSGGRHQPALTGNQAPAEKLEEYPRKAAPETETQVRTYAELGYRNDELKWNKAAPSGTPNILSELQWYNVQSGVITGGTEITFDRNWQVEGKISYAQIGSGENQDSDYAEDNRQAEFSRSNNTTDDGMSVDLSAALGYHLNIGDRKQTPFWRWTPKVGFDFHTQHFRMSQGVQTIPANGAFSGLDSSYEGTWFGPWIGLSNQLTFNERFSLQIGASFHHILYDGTGHWNLRSDLRQPVSFKHKAEGNGIVANAIARYSLTPEWILRLSVDYQNWLTNDNGKDRMLYSDGSSLEMKLNEVQWTSYGLNFGVEYVF